VEKEVGQLKKVIILQMAMTKKGRQFFRKIGVTVTPSVAPRVTPTLVTPLRVGRTVHFK